MVQKKTGSGTSTPDRITLAHSLLLFPASLSFWARRAAAAADAFDDTIVSPVTVLNERRNHKEHLMVGGGGGDLNLSKYWKFREALPA